MLRHVISFEQTLGEHEVERIAALMFVILSLGAISIIHFTKTTLCEVVLTAYITAYSYISLHFQPHYMLSRKLVCQKELSGTHLKINDTHLSLIIILIINEN